MIPTITPGAARDSEDTARRERRERRLLLVSVVCYSVILGIALVTLVLADRR